MWTDDQEGLKRRHASAHIWVVSGGWWHHYFGPKKETLFAHLVPICVSWSYFHHWTPLTPQPFTYWKWRSLRAQRLVPRIVE